MDIPILISGDDASGFTAKDCFGRTATGDTKLEAVHAIKKMHARDMHAENLTSIFVQPINPMAFNIPKAEPTPLELEMRKRYWEALAEVRRERDELDARILAEEEAAEAALAGRERS